jgi:hypothetical protein
MFKQHLSGLRLQKRTVKCNTGNDKEHADTSATRRSGRPQTLKTTSTDHPATFSSACRTVPLQPSAVLGTFSRVGRAGQACSVACWREQSICAGNPPSELILRGRPLRGNVEGNDILRPGPSSQPPVANLQMAQAAMKVVACPKEHRMGRARGLHICPRGRDRASRSYDR